MLKRFYRSIHVLGVAQAGFLAANCVQCGTISAEEILNTYCECESAEDEMVTLHICMSCRGFWECALLLRTEEGKRFCKGCAVNLHAERQLPRVTIALNICAKAVVRHDYITDIEARIGSRPSTRKVKIVRDTTTELRSAMRRRLPEHGRSFICEFSGLEMTPAKREKDPKSGVYRRVPNWPSLNAIDHVVKEGYIHQDSNVAVIQLAYNLLRGDNSIAMMPLAKLSHTRFLTGEGASERAIRIALNHGFLLKLILPKSRVKRAQAFNRLTAAEQTRLLEAYRTGRFEPDMVTMIKKYNNKEGRPRWASAGHSGTRKFTP